MPAFTTTVPRPDVASPAAEPDPVKRYFARVDEITRHMTPAERLVFLRRDHVRWIGIAEEFAARIDSGHMPHPGEDAFAYTLTIAELGARIAREERR